MKKISPHMVGGSITAPPSKSMMQRVVALATMCEGPTLISNPDFGDDSLASIGIARALGSLVEKQKGGLKISPNSGKLSHTLDCSQSGTCMRIFPPIASLGDGKFTFIGSGSLLNRPVGMLADVLNSLGAKAECDNGLLPLSVQGPLQGGSIVLDSSISSQPLSGLLLALPLASGDSRIEALGLESKPYVQLTLHIARQFGATIAHSPSLDNFDINGGQRYTGTRLEIEGDWSGASFFLVAGAINGRLKMTGLNPQSVQADKAVLDAIHVSGAELRVGKENIEVAAPSGKLQSFDFDLSNCPDLAMPLAALAANCSGISRLSGIRRLRFKESDRASALQAEFSKMGVRVEVLENEMKIHGGSVRGGAVDSHNDHRIAMACAIAALKSEHGVEINGEQCVSKSFPNFFESLSEVCV